MKLRAFDHMNCPVAQTLDAVGERWSLLILRDAFFGKRRFQQFLDSLGISRNILSARLQQMVKEKILEKRVVQSETESEHIEYVLTQKGLDLQPVLLALGQWGEAYRPARRGARLTYVERATGKPLRPIAATTVDGRMLSAPEVGVIPGPGADTRIRKKKR